MTDEELIAKLKEQGAIAEKKSAKYIIGMIVCVIGIAAGALCFMLDAYVYGAPCLVVGGIGFVIALPDMMRKSKTASAMRRDVRNAVILPALEQIFENVQYTNAGHIAKDTLSSGGMIPAYSWNTITGGDHVTATYKGLAIEFSDITLEHIEESHEEKNEGNVVLKSEERETIFKGLWLICDFGKELTTDLALLEKSGKTRPVKWVQRKKSDVETENAAFNEKYTILTKNPHEAFYILTPHMMEFIVQMDERAAGDTYMNFSKDGKVHIAVNSGRITFNYDPKKVADNLCETRQRIVSEIRYVTDIIDELRLTESMFKNSGR